MATPGHVSRREMIKLNYLSSLSSKQHHSWIQARKPLAYQEPNIYSKTSKTKIDANIYHINVIMVDQSILIFY